MGVADAHPLCKFLLKFTGLVVPPAITVEVDLFVTEKLHNFRELLFSNQFCACHNSNGLCEVVTVLIW